MPNSSIKRGRNFFDEGGRGACGRGARFASRQPRLESAGYAPFVLFSPGFPATAGPCSSCQWGGKTFTFKLMGPGEGGLGTAARGGRRGSTHAPFRPRQSERRDSIGWNPTRPCTFRHCGNGGKLATASALYGPAPRPRAPPALSRNWSGATSNTDKTRNHGPRQRVLVGAARP